MKRDEFLHEIEKLPSGGITKKKIYNKSKDAYYEYYVYQWRENGKQKSKYLKEDEVNVYQRLIETRKKMENELFVMEQTPKYIQYFYTDVLTGDALKQFSSGVSKFKKRELFLRLESYLYSENESKVFILYGLRRTGKTTMIKQAIFDLNDNALEKTAFIQIKPQNKMEDLSRDLRTLLDLGYKYVFVDEVTLLSDFIEGSAYFSDIYVSSGMKIVLSGTDSLGFYISKGNELYDRCTLVHTTFIPYREFENVLNIQGIDKYIEYGGTMSVSGNHYNVFADKKDVDEYVDSSIAKNIQHSLKGYQDEGHFRSLYSLYENNELTSAINRVVENINHRFTVDVLTKDFSSGDLSISERNLRKETNVLDFIDKDRTTNKLKELLEILNKYEQKVEIDHVCVEEIKEYLTALDLIDEIEIYNITSLKPVDKRNVFTQAGLRYSQARYLIESLMENDIFEVISYQDRKYVFDRILNEIKGRMLEDIVLLETKLAKPDKKVFKLQFNDGEFDMVVFDKKIGECELYEVKFSKEINEKQYRHLVDKEKLDKTEFKYGSIIGKYVLYRGENKKTDGIEYINVEEYLRNL